MGLITLIIALFALYIAFSSYSVSLFDKRFEIYEDSVNILHQFLTLKFSHIQNEKIKTLLWRAKFLFNKDPKIMEILLRAEEYSDYFCDKKEEKSHSIHHSKKEQEMLDWVRDVYLSENNEPTEFEKAFEPYLSTHHPMALLKMIKTAFEKLFNSMREIINRH